MNLDQFAADALFAEGCAVSVFILTMWAAAFVLWVWSITKRRLHNRATLDRLAGMYNIKRKRYVFGLFKESDLALRNRVQATITGLGDRTKYDMPYAAPTSAPEPIRSRPPSNPWDEALRISELPEVDEALRAFVDSSSEDNAVCLVRIIIGEARASPAPLWFTEEGRVFGCVSDEQIESVLENALADVRKRSGLGRGCPQDDINMPEPDLKAGVLAATDRELDAWGELLDKSRGYGETDELFRRRLLMEIAQLKDEEDHE